jgi:aquaporin Z
VAATAAGAVLLVIANGQAGFSAVESGFATNGYGERSPGGYSVLACLVVEVVLTAIFLYIILGATDDRAPKGFAPIAIGLGLTLIHLVSIPVTNTSVNPARSLGGARFGGGAAHGQVWLFIVAPIIGAAIAGATYAAITAAKIEIDEGVGNNPNVGTATPAAD